MKPKIFLFIPLILCLLSCGQKTENTSETTSPDSNIVANSMEVPIITCYEGISNQDTFRLRVEKFEDRVTGTLAYLFHEKDRNIGDYEGRMHGDTMVADYIFLSEGSSSVRQVAFLLNDQVAKEGYGQMAEQDGKMVFTNMKSLSFGKGVTMFKQNCSPNTEQIISKQNDVLSGTWELNYISGSKIAFDGLYPGKKPQLIFASAAPEEFSGNTGCNSIRGKFYANDTEIKFKEPMAMTKMYCESGGEQAFLNMLKKVNIFNLSSNTLTFLADDVEVMRFSKK
jgi:heat shock protein HslJ